MENKKSLSTILFGVALLLFVCAIFAMFGKVVTHIGASELPNMFQTAFGTTGAATNIRVPGLTAIFVFQMIIIACVISIIVGTITHKFHYILTMILYGVICLCAFIAFIISFNAVNLYCAARGGSLIISEYGLGAGPIIYSIMHILGLLTSLVGFMLSRRGK